MAASPTDALKDAAEKLAQARLAFENADSEYRGASNKQTDALNKLNTAQKAFDAAVEALRREAPPASDWKQSSRQAMAVQAAE